MEFTGRIKQILPLRSGVSASTGNEWKSLPFIFEYFEHDTDRWPDSVLLETRHETHIKNLKEGMEVRCGFSHKAKEITRKDGSGKTIINEMQLYKMECISMPTQQQNVVATNGDPAVVGPTAQPTPAPQPQPGAQEGAGDDLPF